MRILAIDPGSHLGWATNATGRLEWGTENFTIRNGESSGNRWRRFGEWLNDVSLKPPIMRDFESMKASVSNLPKPGNGVVDLIVYERAMFMPKARAAAEIAAGFTTRIEEHCERHGIALDPVSVQTIKAFALPKRPRKKGDPKMDRSKDAMIVAAKARLWLFTHKNDPKAERGGLDAFQIDEHQADALWLYWLTEARCTPS